MGSSEYSASQVNTTVTVNLNQVTEPQNLTSIQDEIPGTLAGHALPVVGWFSVGLSYLILTLKHFYDCKLQRAKFKSSVEFPCRLSGLRIFSNCKSLPVTAWAKFIIGNMYFDYDVLFAGVQKMDTKLQLPHFQHDTIAATFLLSGLVDLIYVWPYTRQLLPLGIDYVFFSLPFFTEVLQFVTHLHGRAPVDVRLHQLQATVAAMTVLTLAAEASSRHRPELPVIRALLVTLQGTWMCHLMFILYHPLGLQPWDLHSDGNVELVSLFFVWHIILLLCLGLCIDLVFAWRYSCSIKHKKRSGDTRPLMTWSEAQRPQR